MMEFTLARVSACICGVMVIAILFNPVVSSYDDGASDLNGENCEALGEMFDSFMESQTDESAVALGIMLPDNETRVSFEGHTMTMSNPRGTWTYELRNPVIADADSYGSNDLLLLTKYDGCMAVESVRGHRWRLKSIINGNRDFFPMSRLTLKKLSEHMVIIWRSYRLVHFNHFLLSYMIVYVAVSIIVWVLDPDVKGLSDAFWFTFQTGTTIGYGDLIVNNTFARIVTMVFSVYSMALVAVFTGILAGYFVEIIKSQAQKSAVKFLLDLERLPDMTHEELVELSERAKVFAREEW